MDTQEIFKWTAATVSAIVAVIVIAVTSGWVYGVEDTKVADGPHEAEVTEAAEPAHKEPAPEPAPAAEPTIPAAPEAGGGDLAALLANGDAAAGVALLVRCQACHALDEPIPTCPCMEVEAAGEGGAQRVGPNIWGIVGTAKGASEGYAYSDSLANAGGTWTFADLDGYLAAPKEWMPGTKMTFSGISDAADRANAILSLRALSNDPVPLP